MKSEIKVIFFDLGNTLIYDNPSLWDDIYLRADHSLWKTLHKFGVDLSSYDLIGEFKTLFDYYYKLREGDLEEPGIGEVLNELLKEHNISLTKEDLQVALRSMYSITQTNWFLEDDAIPTLQVLLNKGYHLGIISNGSDDLNTYELMDKMGLRIYFDFVLSSSAIGKRKPHPAIFRSALDNFNIYPNQAVMVGDNYEADILGARQLGMKTIWVTRHLQSKIAIPQNNAEINVSHLSDLLNLL